MTVGRATERTTSVGAVLVVLALLVIACGVGDGSSSSPTPRSAADKSPPGPATPVSVPVIPRPAAAGVDRRRAVSAAARAISHFPVPPGSTRVHGPPPHAGYLRRAGAQDGEVDLSLTRTRWWLVPWGYRRVIDWYVAQTPADRRETEYPSGRVATMSELDWETHGSSRSFSPPAMVMAYLRLGRDRTAIRTEVTLAARADRTARTLVPSTVTSLSITRRAIDGPDAGPRTVTVADRALVYRVVEAFDRAPGQFADTEPAGCGSPVGIVHEYAVTFHWPGHTLAADTGEPLCDIGRRLTRDGATLPQTLSDDRPLVASLKAAFDGS